MATTLNQNGVRDEDSLRFFHVLSSRDPNTRKHSFDMIRMTLDAWANGYGSPKDQILVGNGNPLPINPLVEEHLPDILRLSTNCPFEDVREWCSNLLADIQVSFCVDLIVLHGFSFREICPNLTRKRVIWLAFHFPHNLVELPLS